MTKLKVMGDIVEGKTLLSHVVMQEIHKTQYFKDLEADSKSDNPKEITKEERYAETLEIKLTVNGEEIDPIAYFNKIEEGVDRMVTAEANKLIQRKTSEVLEDITDRLFNMKDVVESWGETINWDYKPDLPSPYQREEDAYFSKPDLPQYVLYNVVFPKKKVTKEAWKNYVPGPAREMWQDLSNRERVIFYQMAKAQAEMDK